MKNNSSLILLTLASNNKKVVISKDNIAFAMEIEEENDNKKKIQFTRVFLKQLTISNDSSWVDVVEKPKDLYEKCGKE